MGQIANAHPQGGLVLCLASLIPGASTKLRQTTGSHATDLEGVLKPASQFSTACGP